MVKVNPISSAEQQAADVAIIKAQAFDEITESNRQRRQAVSQANQQQKLLQLAATEAGCEVADLIPRIRELVQQADGKP